MSNEFKTYHPVVNFLYFLFVIGFSCVFIHPLCLWISLAAAFIYSVVLNGKKKIKTNIMYMLPIFVCLVILNPIFNRGGDTVIFYLPGKIPFTLEAVIYALVSANMVVSVICWFSCYNEVMTSDKFIYLFGKIAPSISLIFSMTLRFVPKFTNQLKSLSNVWKTMGRDILHGSIIKRAKNALSIFSVMITWSLESAIDTADSMKSRGYGTRKRTSFSIYKFDKRDAAVLISILALATYVIISYYRGEMQFTYFPSIRFSDISFISITTFGAYLLLCFVPIIIEIKEIIKWKCLK